MICFASSSFSTRMWRALYSLSPRCARILSYSALSCGVVDRVGLEEVLAVGVDQDLLAHELELRLDLGALREALARGFLRDDLADDQLVAHRVAQLGRVRRALRAACAFTMESTRALRDRARRSP